MMAKNYFDKQPLDSFLDRQINKKYIRMHQQMY